MIRIERMFIFKQKDKIWNKVHSQNSAEKDFMATLSSSQKIPY